MQLRRTALVLLGLVVFCATATTVAWAATSHFHAAHARVYDPAKTHLAQAGWIAGIGCPTGAGISTSGGHKPNTTYTDPACPTGDRRDRRNEGLLLAKTGPTANNASGVADLRHVKGTVLTELGYDLRKVGSTADPVGSHCGAGAPRFNVTTKDGTTYFIGCNSPAPDTQNAGLGWLRLRWGAAGVLMAYGPSGLTNISGMTVRSIRLVFDEGQDSGPDSFGLAVLDNIDVNGTLVGEGNSPSGR